MHVVGSYTEESMAKGKKIKLQKRSTPLTRTREGLSLPEGAGNSGYIGFSKRTGLERKNILCVPDVLGRMPFALRMFVLFCSPILCLPLFCTIVL